MMLKIETPLPALDGATEWLQGEATQGSLLGCFTIVHFWAVSCPVCKQNMPGLRELVETYSPQGLQVVSVHMPRFEFDMDVAAVVQVIREMNLMGPCAIDNQHLLGDRFGVTAWPSYFLFDRDCKLRSRAAGKIGLKTAENSVLRLLALEGGP